MPHGARLDTPGTLHHVIVRGIEWRNIVNEHNVPIDALRSGSRRRMVSEARQQLTLKLVNELGWSFAETGRQLGLTTSGVAQILRRKS